MKQGFLIGGIVILAILGLTLFSLMGRGVDTATQMADKTVFNADKHVWSYEEFHRKYTQYQQYEQQKKDAEEEISKLEAKGTKSGQRYDNLSTELDGCRNMLKRIAAEYNAMSQIAYQKFWKSKGLPEQL